MRKIIAIVLLLSILNACSKKNELEVDVSNITAKINVKRFEQIFYTANSKDLPKIKSEFRAIFPHDNDSIWLQKMQDKDELELYAEVQKIYPNFNNETKKLKELIKHIKYYYPKFTTPEIITVISNIPLEQKVILDRQTMYISLDVFLGKDNSFYNNYPLYIKKNLTKKQLIVEVAKVFAKQTQFKVVNRTFVSRMIEHGKLLYTLNAFLPSFKEFEKIGYTNEELSWVKTNEEMIWRYFIDKKLLYKTDYKLDRRFIEDAPFSKFYMDVDQESPGKVGVWLGWQIVKSYIKNNKVTLQEMLKEDNEILFKKSKYKPKK